MNINEFNIKNGNNLIFSQIDEENFVLQIPKNVFLNIKSKIKKYNYHYPTKILLVKKENSIEKKYTVEPFLLRLLLCQDVFMEASNIGISNEWIICLNKDKIFNNTEIKNYIQFSWLSDEDLKKEAMALKDIKKIILRQGIPIDGAEILYQCFISGGL